MLQSNFSIKSKNGALFVGDKYPCFIIAEVSANHEQNIEKAKKIIHEASMAGANAIKLQTYLPSTMTLNCKNKHFIIQKSDNGREYDLEKYMFNFEFPKSKDEDKIFVQTKDVSELEQNMRAALLCLTSRLSELSNLNAETDDPKIDYTFNFRLHTSNEGARAIADDFRWCKAPSSFKETKLVESSFDDMDTEQTEGFSICDLVEAKSKQLSKPDDSKEEKSESLDVCKETKHEKYLVEPTAEDIELLSTDEINASNVVTPVYSFTVPFKLSIMIEHKEE